VRRLAWIVAVMLGAGAPAQAGVPLYLGRDGQPARHVLPVESHPTTSVSDPSGGSFLGSIVAQAGDVWSGVATTQLAFEQGVPVAEPITLDNYLDYLAVCGDGISPLVSDVNGAIVDDLFGDGASTSVLGVGLSDCSTLDGVIEEHTLLMNLSLLPDTQPARDALALRVATHEIGHVIGLAHSLLGFEFVADGNAANDAWVPMMAPVLSDDDVLAPPLLTLDDRAMVSFLYPAAGFVAGTGTIAGTTRLPLHGRPVSGTFVVVRSTTDPLGTALFATSGLVATGVVAGGFVGSLGDPGEPTGVFQASGLPPGAYTVEVIGGLSGEQPEFFSGAAERHDPGADPPDAATPITLGPGSVMADANVLLNAGSGTTGSPLLDTAWRVAWSGRAKVPGIRERLGEDLLPPIGRIELLASGGLVFRSGSSFYDVLFGGHWTPILNAGGAVTRRFEHDLDVPGSALEFAESLFSGAATVTALSAGGRVNKRATKIRGSITMRGQFFAGRRSLPLTLAYKYTGSPLPTGGGEPGPVPPIPPIAVVVTPLRGSTTPGGQVSFAASVEGAPPGVTWEISGPGSIDAGGRFTASAEVGRVHVVARSASDPRAVGLASVDVAP
jgi:hypothetical protein